MDRESVRVRLCGEDIEDPGEVSVGERDDKEPALKALIESRRNGGVS